MVNPTANSAYFLRTGPASYRATEHTSGAWSTADQHIAPTIGLLAHLLEDDFAARREDPMVLCRMSYDILGTMPVGEVGYDIRVLRPGATIELAEVTLTAGGRPAVVMRGWFMQERDTAAFAGSTLDPIPGPGEHEEWAPSQQWPGGALRALSCRRLVREPGRATFWLSTDVPLVDDAPVSPLAQAAAKFDFANGMATRADPQEVMFPNVDLTAHIFRTPEPGWLGFDTSVSFGESGLGLTHSILHDATGPLGSLSQMLTVRPVRPGQPGRP